MKILHYHSARVNSGGGTTIEEAKERIRIPELWRHFGFTGEPTKSCKSPFRDDKHPSFSISEDGKLWHDFSTKEGGDALDFLQRASGLSKKEACRKFIELAGGRLASRPQPKSKTTEPGNLKSRPVFPEFKKGTAEDIKKLASLRNIGCEGLEWANERGLLWFATLKDYPAWIVTDVERVNAQARRMDGKLWGHINAKSWTLPGSWAAWPIGIGEAQRFSAIALCEGGPDFLAAHYEAIWEQAPHYSKRHADCAPVAMLGASQRIHELALPMFADKRVRIFGHADEVGRAAVERWARQLETVGADVDAFNFAGLMKTDGEAVEDLNDALLMDAASFTEAVRMMPL